MRWSELTIFQPDSVGRRGISITASFALGAFLHILFWRGFVYFEYAGSPASTRAFVDSPLTNIGIPIACGISVAFFFGWFLAKRARFDRGWLRTAGATGLYSLGATFCGFEAFYLLASIYLAVVPPVPGYPPTASMIPGEAVAWMIEFAFFGAIPVAVCLPFSFVFGFLGGCSIWRAWRHQYVSAEN